MRHWTSFAQREASYENLVEYCRARRKGFEGLEDYTQPLIEVSYVPVVANHLNPTSRPVAESKKNPAKCRPALFIHLFSLCRKPH